LPNSALEHPVLRVSIGGAATKQPSCFSLITDAGCPWAAARLRYPADMADGKAGDPAGVSLSLAGEEHPLFAGIVHAANVRGAYRDLELADGYIALANTPIAPAYRKETAKAILQDILDAAGIAKTAIACPAVELARFSSNTVPASYCIALLIKAIEGHGHAGLRYFFDEKDTFRFGTLRDTGKNDGAVYEFETGKNILVTAEGKIEVLPLPIRHSQKIKVDGRELVTARTDLTISGAHSRLALWLAEAP